MKLLTIISTVGLLQTCLVASADTTTHLSELDLSNMSSGWRIPQRNTAASGDPLTVAGVTYTNGIGTHAPSSWTLKLDGKATEFKAFVGIQNQSPNNRGSAAFVVRGDGKELFRSPVMRWTDKAVPVSVDLRGVKMLELEVTDGGNIATNDEGDWIEPVIVHDGAKPVPATDGERFSPASGDWLNAVCAKLSTNDATLVQRGVATLLDNIVVTPAWAPLRGIEPAANHYHGVWNWDSAFHTLATSQWDAQLTREQFDIIFSIQQPNGAIPCFIGDNGQINSGVREWDQSQPPVMTWAVAVADHRQPDDKYLHEVYPKLVKMGEFWRKERGGDKDGLFYYASKHTGYESGWDNSFRWDGGYQQSQSDHQRLWPIDLNCYMVAHYRALAYMAGRLNLPAERTKWIAEADELAKRINQKLWNDVLGFYVDCDRATGKSSKVMTPAGFMPLFVHIAPRDRAERLAKIAADPKKFSPGMPCAAYDTPGFNSHDYWRGPTWINISYFALKGLKDYGCGELAGQMRTTLLDRMLKEKSSLREYYDSRTGAGLGAQTYGWTGAFAIAFILDWENDHLTWLFQECPVPLSRSRQSSQHP